MKRCIWSWSLVGLFIASSVLAADPIVVLRDDGTYLLRPDAMSLVKVTVVDQRGGGTPNPQPPPPTPTPTPDTLTKKVSDWAKQVNDPDGREFIATVYDQMRISIASGELPADSDKIDEALTHGLNRACDTLDSFPQIRLAKPRREVWRPFRDKVADEWVLAINRGGGTLTKDKHAAFFGDVEKGLRTANVGHALPEWLVPILRTLIDALIQWILTRFGV